MPLPSSGSLSTTMIMSELGISIPIGGFSIPRAAYGDYVTINQNSSFKPPSSGQVSMSDWYGYDHNASSGLFSSSFSYHPSDPNAACSDTNRTARWYSGLSFGDFFYEDSGGTVLQSNGFLSDGTTVYRIFGKFGGQIIEVLSCGNPSSFNEVDFQVTVFQSFSTQLVWRIDIIDPVTLNPVNIDTNVTVTIRLFVNDILIGNESLQITSGNSSTGDVVLHNSGGTINTFTWDNEDLNTYVGVNQLYRLIVL